MKFFQLNSFEVSKNPNVLDSFKNKNNLGIEITDKNIASILTAGNIDHHRMGDDDNTPAACEQAIQWPYFDGNIIIQIPDADSLTAAAILLDKVIFFQCAGEYFNQTGGDLEPVKELDIDLIKSIGKIDRLGVHACPVEINNIYITAIRAVINIKDLSLEDKIYMIKDLLYKKDIPDIVYQQIENDKKLLAEAKENSKITILEKNNKKITFIESTLPFATQIAYEISDICIAFNNKMLKDFKNPDMGTYKKWTISLRDSHVKAKINFDNLNKLESGWGGRATIGGSPQGVDSILTIDQILSCIEKI